MSIPIPTNGYPDTLNQGCQQPGNPGIMRELLQPGKNWELCVNFDYILGILDGMIPILDTL